jgi:integrase
VTSRKLPAKPAISADRFAATPDGFFEYRQKSGDALKDSSWRKWRPIIVRAEELRVEMYAGAWWSELNPEDIAFELLDAVCTFGVGRDGGEVSTNTQRGRYNACNAYFAFLCRSGHLSANPCDWITAPSSKPNERPFLEPSEDEKLARVDKELHEIAVYALTRGASLREGEAVELDDADVDLANDVIVIRDGKTGKARRRIPITATTHVLLARYRAERDATPTIPKTSRFLRTQSGSISAAYIWKLVKAMARRAEVGFVYEDGHLLLDPDGEPLTRVTPHALRRTFGSDLVNRGMQTVILYPIMGHASPKVTEESYALASSERRAREVMLAAGEGPFSLAHGVSELDAELARVRGQVPTDPKAALAELRRLQTVAAELERSLLRVAPEANLQPTSVAA